MFALAAATLAGLLALLVALPSDADLRVFGTPSADVADTAPFASPGWAETDVNDEISVDLDGGERFYLAAVNDDDLGRVKFWTVGIEGPLAAKLDIALPMKTALGGFLTPDDSQPVTGDFVGSHPPKKWTFRFTPQPRWERLTLKATQEATGLLKVRAASLCTDMSTNVGEVRFDDTSFDSPSGLGGAPLYRGFEVFPATTPADTSVTPTIVAPAGTGEWSSEFVDTDPNGVPRPLGVRFFTVGAPPGRPNVFDHFDFAFSMLGSADTVYDAFVFDEASGEYAHHVLTLSSPQVPALPRAAFMLLALALAAVGQLTLRPRASRQAAG